MFEVVKNGRDGVVGTLARKIHGHTTYMFESKKNGMKRNSDVNTYESIEQLEQSWQEEKRERKEQERDGYDCFTYHNL